MERNESGDADGRPRERWVRAALLGVVLLTAVLFRMTALGTVPEGMDPDEALNGNEGLQAQQSRDYRVFYPANNGREGLFINLIGISESIVGPGMLGLRIPAAVVGSLTVLFVFLLGEQMVGWRAALLGCWLLATNFWHVAISRMGYRAILVPLLLTASLYLLVLALRDESGELRARQLALAALGGSVYGLGFHSYIAYRITPLVVLAFAGADLRVRLRRRQSVRPWVAIMAAWWAAAVLVALPIGLYFARHPEDFSHRMDQLNVLRQPHVARAIWKGVVAATLQFNVRGDAEWSRNLASAPLLLWPAGLLFLLGCALAVWAAMQRREHAVVASLLLCWLVVMLVPSALAGRPSSLRALGTITPVFLLAGWGAEWIYARVRSNRIARGLFFAVLLATATTEAYRYFGVWAHAAETRDDLHADAVEKARMLNSLPLGTPRYVLVDRDDDDYRVLHKNPDGTEINLPYIAGIVLLETRRERVPVFLFEDEAASTPMPPGSVLVQMYPSADFYPRLRAKGVRLRPGVINGVPYAQVE